MKLLYEHLLDIVPKKCQNGCGPKGFGWLIPDRIFLVDFEKACNIHDCCYSLPKKFTKKHADEIFYKNLKTINKTKSPTKIGYLARKPIIWMYYKSVSMFGGKYYPAECKK